MLWRNPEVAFIHIPKTGGSSIEYFAHRCHWLLGRDGHVGQHSTLQDCVNRVGDLSGYKVFTVVRNTYDRILSAYLMGYNRKSFLMLKRENQRRYVSFPEFYNNIDRTSTHCEDIFHYLAVDGVIPDYVKLLNFDNLEGDFKKFWVDECGFELSAEFPHINQSPTPEGDLREYLGADPEFRAFIEREYAAELDYLGDMFEGS